MIFNNFVDDGTVLTSTIWNRAWGLEGTAKSLYDSIGAQQYHNTIYNAFSWISATQTLSTGSDEIVQFNFTPGVTYQSSDWSGSLNNWQSGMATISDFRDRITIQRDGYYLIHAECSINDASNRICSSNNTDSCTTEPKNSVTLTIQSDSGTGILTPERVGYIRPNVAKAATYNIAEVVPPHASIIMNYIEVYRKGDIISMTTVTVDGAARNERIVNAGLKAFLIKATEINNYNYYIDQF